MRKIAIIDVGSSTVKLSIFDIDEENNNKAMVIRNKAVTTNLAEGLYPNLMLGEKPIERAANAVKELVSEARNCGTEEIKIVSTGAARKAKNGKQLVDAVKKSTALDLRIISGEEEAEIFYKGVVSDFVDHEDHFAAMNIGGGSTELVLGTRGKIERLTSLPIGVSALNEKFLRSDPPIDNEHQRMVKHIRKILNGERIVKAPEGTILLHAGGELYYMQQTGYELEDFVGSPSHPKKLSLERFAARNREIRKMTKEKLRSFMPENPRWMDGAIACNAIAETIADALGVKIIVPSNKNLNDGLLLTALGS